MRIRCADRNHPPSRTPGRGSSVWIRRPTSSTTRAAPSRTSGRSSWSATALALPAASGSADYVVSGLVLNFIPDPDAALAEMSRVATDGATIAAYVWDYAEGMQMLRAFWDAAVALDPGAADLDESTRFPLCRPEPLRRAVRRAGLSDVEQSDITVATDVRRLRRLLDAVPQRPGPGARLLRVAVAAGPGPAARSPPRRSSHRTAARSTSPLEPGRSRGPGSPDAPCRST